MAEATRGGTGGAAAVNTMADDLPEIPDEITENNPLFLRPLSEDLLHFKILSEKFDEVRIRLVGSLQAERARCAELEKRLEETVEAEKFASRSLKKALVDAKDHLLLGRLLDHFRKENGELKDEIKELKNRASVEADVAATRQAAWQREAQEAQRALELERQTAREQAREARELADKERNALQEAARKSAEEVQRRHDEEVAALRDEIKSIREECAEEVNLATLEFEDRSTQHSERVTVLEAEIMSLQEQLSAATGQIGYMESRVAGLQAERSRLQEVNRSLMLQQQRQAAQAPRGPPKSRPSTTPAPPGFQLASSVYAPPTRPTAPTAPASTASQSAMSYPQLPVAWWNRAGTSSQCDAVPSDADSLPGTLEPPASPPMPKQRRGRRKLFDDVDFVLPPLPERRLLTMPAASAVPPLAERRPSTTPVTSVPPPTERRPSTTPVTSVPPPAERRPSTTTVTSVPPPAERRPSTTPVTSVPPLAERRPLTTPVTSVPPPAERKPSTTTVTSVPPLAERKPSTTPAPADSLAGQPSKLTADKSHVPGKFSFKRRTMVGSFSSRGEGIISATPAAAAAPEPAEADAEENTAQTALSPRTVAGSGSSRHDGGREKGSPPVEIDTPTAPAETPKQPAANVFFFEGRLNSGVQRKPPQPTKAAAPKAQTAGKGKQDRPGPPTAGPAASKATKQKTIPDSFLQCLSKLPADKARWSVPTDHAPAAAVAAGSALVQMQTPAQSEPRAAERRPDRDGTRQFFQRQLQLQTPAPGAIPLTASELESATPVDAAKPAPCHSSSTACPSTSARVDASCAPEDQLQQSAVTVPTAVPAHLRDPIPSVKTAAVQLQADVPSAAADTHQQRVSVPQVTPVQLPVDVPSAAADQHQQRVSVPQVTPVQLPVDVPSAAADTHQQRVSLPTVTFAQLLGDAPHAAMVQHQLRASPFPVTLTQRQVDVPSAPIDQTQQNRASLPPVTLAQLPVEAPSAPLDQVQQSEVILPAAGPAQLPADAAATCPAAASADRQQPVDAAAADRHQPVDAAAADRHQPLDAAAADRQQPLDAAAADHQQPVDAAAADRQQPLDAAAADEGDAAPRLAAFKDATAGASTSPPESVRPSESVRPPESIRSSDVQPEVVTVECEPAGSQAGVEVAGDDFPLTQRMRQPDEDEDEECFISLSLADVSLDTDLSFSTTCPTQIEPSTSEVEPPAAADPASQASAVVPSSPQTANGGGPETPRPEASQAKRLPTPEGPRATEPHSAKAATVTPQSGGAADERGVGLDEVDQDAATPKLPTVLETCALLSTAAEEAPKALPVAAPSSDADSSTTVVVLESKSIQDAAPSLPSANTDDVDKMTKQESVAPEAPAASANLCQQALVKGKHHAQSSGHQFSRSPGPRASMVSSPLAAVAATQVGDAEVALQRDQERRSGSESWRLQPLFSSPPSPAPAAFPLGKPLAALRLGSHGDASSQRDDNEVPVIDEVCAAGGRDSVGQGEFEEVHALLVELLSQSEDVRGQSKELLDQPKKLFGQPKDLLGQHKEVLDQSEAEEHRQPEEVLGQPKELLSQTKEVLGQPKELLSQTKEVLGQPKELLSQTKEVLGQPKELLSQTKEVLGQPKELLSQTKEVLGQPKELLSQPKEVLGQPKELLGQPKEVHGQQDALLVRQAGYAPSQPAVEAAEEKEEAGAGQATPPVDRSSPATTSGGSGGAESISYSPLSEIDNGDGEGELQVEDADEASTSAGGQVDSARSPLLGKNVCSASGQSDSLDGEDETRATLTQRNPSSTRKKWRPPLISGPGLALLQEAYEIGCSQQVSSGRRSNKSCISSSPSCKATPSPPLTKDSSDAKKRGPSPTELAEPTACEPPAAAAAEPAARPSPSRPDGSTGTTDMTVTPQRPKRERTSKKRRLLDALDTFEY